MRCRSRRPAPLEALRVIVQRSGNKFVAGPGASFDYLLNSLRRYLQVLHRGFLYALKVQRLRRCTLIPIRGTISSAVGETYGRGKAKIRFRPLLGRKNSFIAVPNP